MWHKRQWPKLFNTFFQHASDVHSCYTRYAATYNLHKPRARKDIGKQTISFMAIDV